jgi:NADH:ubiquinone oxidoreductase subunit 6 (subunit J)
MVFMNWLKKAPTSVTITVISVCGVLAVAILIAYVVLSLNGGDTTEFRQWINTVGQILVFPLLGTTAVASVAAARSSSAAEDQTNGQLTAKDRKIAELEAQLRDRDAA